MWDDVITIPHLLRDTMTIPQRLIWPNKMIHFKMHQKSGHYVVTLVEGWGKGEGGERRMCHLKVGSILSSHSFSSLFDHLQRKKRQAGSSAVQTVMVGGSDQCGPSDIPCNGPLNPGSSYRVRYRLFSGNQSTDYAFVGGTFTTGTG